MQENPTFTIEISNGWRKIFWHRKFFREQGFSFQKKAYGKSYYYMKTKDYEECERYQEFCRFRGLKCHIFNETYMRSSNYRNQFFTEFYRIHGSNKKYTLCAYCGLPSKVDKLTVDHIIPVDKAKKTNMGKFLMKIFRIQNINEYRNLCAACKSCNSRKGKKMGLWILRGFIGKSVLFWYIRWALRSAIITLLILQIIQLGKGI